jgi:hypothetical protein
MTNEWASFSGMKRNADPSKIKGLRISGFRGFQLFTGSAYSHRWEVPLPIILPGVVKEPG